MKKLLFTVFALCLAQPRLFAQEEDTNNGEKYTRFEQQPGLAKAASKVFYSEKPWSISGFGEISYVNGHLDNGISDLELTYMNLYRLSGFFGYRFSDKLIWNSEVMFEYLRDKEGNDHHEFIIEAFFDLLLSKQFNVRAGLYPLGLGYINNNDDPVMFYSVNRSDVERLIIPSTWMAMGVSFYGTIAPKLSYTFGLAQGIEAAEFTSGTWLRLGREPRFEAPQTLAVNPQLIYNGVKDLSLSASAYIGQTGNKELITYEDGSTKTADAMVQLYTAYARYKKHDWELMALGSWGFLNGTEDIYHLTQARQGQAQVLGSQTVGYLLEGGYDLLSLFNGRKFFNDKNFFIDPQNVEIPIFVRYEYINTHKNFNEALITDDANFTMFNTDIVTVGVNFKPREEIAFKFDYQFRMSRGGLAVEEGNMFELGIGFIF
ncbi:porin [Sediminitomix flava]|uniref:Phosphate-selective porin O/P n=1 Tax=Sediminitomix flava TaxID=379075 RepID=A0A315ZC20_SEDFL|nr:porin [Sediminitomix flava]PWJ42852.1 hypothetical protein BC781_102398 [Sediminitomix flava]